MKHKMILLLSALALTSACAKSNPSARNFGANGGNSELSDSAGKGGSANAGAIDPEQVNDVASSQEEEKALTILTQEETRRRQHNQALSQLLTVEIKGVSVKILNDVTDEGRRTGKFIIKMDVSSLKDNECSSQTLFSSPVTKFQMVSEFAQVPQGGRFRCLEAACENALLVIEQSRRIMETQDDGKRLMRNYTGSQAVLLKKDSEGLLTPVTTISEDFFQVFDQHTGLVSCQESQAPAASTSEESAVTTEGSVSGNATETLSTSDRVRNYQREQIRKQREAAEAREAARKALEGHTLHMTGR